MIIEIGKEYFARDGKKWKVTSVSKNGVVYGGIGESGIYYSAMWYIGGNCLSTAEPRDDDLVEEAHQYAWEWCEITKPGLWAYGGSAKKPIFAQVLSYAEARAESAWRAYIGPTPTIHAKKIYTRWFISGPTIHSSLWKEEWIEQGKTPEYDMFHMCVETKDIK